MYDWIINFNFAAKMMHTSKISENNVHVPKIDPIYDI